MLSEVRQVLCKNHLKGVSPYEHNTGGNQNEAKTGNQITADKHNGLSGYTPEKTHEWTCERQEKKV